MFSFFWLHGNPGRGCLDRDSRLVGIATELGGEGLEEWLCGDDLSSVLLSFDLLVFCEALACDVSMYREFCCSSSFL